MRRTALQPLGVYAVKTAHRAATPALLVDDRLWDLTPTADGPAFTLAPEDAVWGGKLNSSTGARRGVLVIQVTPAVAYAASFKADAVVARMGTLAKKRDVRKLSGLRRPDALQQTIAAVVPALPEQLMMNVVNPLSIVRTWEPEKQYRCPGCEAPVVLDAADRVRSHETPQGGSCTAIGDFVPHEQRIERLITTAS